MQGLYEIIAKARSELIALPNTKRNIHKKKHFNKLNDFARLPVDHAALIRHVQEGLIKFKPSWLQQFGIQEKNYYQHLLMLEKVLLCDCAAEQGKRVFALHNVIITKSYLHELDDIVQHGGIAVLDKTFQGESKLIPKGVTALHTSCIKDSSVFTSRLLDYGITCINKQDALGNTALMYASKAGNLESVKKLILAGADINIKNKKGETALFLAAANNKSEVVVKLLSYKADPNIFTNDGASPLSAAVFYNNLLMVFLLTKNNAKIDPMTYKIATEKHQAGDLIDIIYAKTSKPYIIRQNRILAVGAWNKTPNTKDKSKPFSIMKSLIFFEEKSAIDSLRASGIAQLVLQKHLAPLVAITALQQQRTEHASLSILGIHAKNISKIYPLSRPTTSGFEYDESRIYLATDNDPKLLLLQFFHELTHYVCYVVFGNAGNPFKENAPEPYQKARQQVQNNLYDLPAKTSLQRLLKRSFLNVFDNDKYSLLEQDKELIVKIPEVICVLGEEAGISYLTTYMPLLLEYYEMNFIPACQRYLQRHQAEQYLDLSVPSVAVAQQKNGFFASKVFEKKVADEKLQDNTTLTIATTNRIFLCPNKSEKKG